MGFRFRRSIKIAPGIRLNLNTKSTSARIGPRGLGYTISSTGRKHVSAGIPGTGLHFTEQISPARKTRPAQRESIAQPLDLIETEKRTPSGLSIVITIAAILIGVAWCSGKPSAPTTSIEAPRQSENIEVAPPVTPTNPPANVSIVSQAVTPPIIELFTTTAVRLRSGPSTDTEAILTVPPGEMVKSSRTEGRWHNVTYRDRTGWIRGDYLAEKKQAEVEPLPAAPLISPPSRRQATRPARRSVPSGYIRGPRGGCYYINSNGNKSYVSRSLC